MLARGGASACDCLTSYSDWLLMPSSLIPETLPYLVTAPILPLFGHEALNTQNSESISSFPFQQPSHHHPFWIVSQALWAKLKCYINKHVTVLIRLVWALIKTEKNNILHCFIRIKRRIEIWTTLSLSLSLFLITFLTFCSTSSQLSSTRAPWIIHYLREIKHDGADVTRTYLFWIFVSVQMNLYRHLPGWTEKSHETLRQVISSPIPGYIE